MNGSWVSAEGQVPVGTALESLTTGRRYPWQLAFPPEPPAIILEGNRGKDLLLNPGRARSRAVICV